MNQTILEHDAQAILNQLKRKTRAKDILSKPISALPSALVSCLGVGVGIFLISSSGFVAPLAVQVFLIMGLVGSIQGVVESILIRRRLEAAIDLIRLQEERNKESYLVDGAINGNRPTAS